ncbi:MAG: hypothetical protein PHU53_05630 [Thermoplasmata archaeon]|nr:hypothetical protein [Thermoplasmata archaeon]
MLILKLRNLLRMRFSYSKADFIIRFGAGAMVLVIMLAVLSVPGVDMLVLWGFGAIALGFMAIILLSPLATDHEVADSSIILRQGMQFSASIPFSEVAAVESVSIPIMSSAARKGRIVLTGSRRNLVMIKLKRPRRFSQLLWRSSDEILLDVHRPEEFLKLVNEKLK